MFFYILFQGIPILSHFQRLSSCGYCVKVTAKKAGKKVSKTLKATVTVKNPSLTLKAASEVAVGATEQITATVKPANTKVTYTSSDKEIATVDTKGVVTGVKAGAVTITVKAGKTTKTVKMTVVAALSAKQTKAKEITVTSATPVTKDSKISLKRGSVEIALDEKNGVTIDSTGKTVVLTTAAKLIKGDYTLTIDDNKAEFTAEDEKVASIEFTSDKAVLAKAVSNVYTTATAAFKVYNQFNEDVTDAKKNAIAVNGNGTYTATKPGVITFTNNTGYRLNDIVAAVVIYQEGASAVTKSGTFTISNEAAIAEITVKDGVYNKKGEAVSLTEDYDFAKNNAYVLVSAKDQYGNAVTSFDWSSANTKNSIVQVAGGLTYLTAATTTSEEITVDGVKYAGIKLAVEANKTLGAGTATILVVSNGTGVTAQGTVNVANGVKVDTISINVPTIYGGENNELTYTALDTYGKEVTSVSALKKVTGIADTEATGAIWVKEDPITGKAKLYYKAASNQTGIATYDVKSLLTQTYKASTVNFTIQPNAVATAITGTKDLVTGALKGSTITVKLANIKVVDQYGRAFTPASPYKVNVSIDGTDGAGFTTTGDLVATGDTGITSSALSAGETKVKFTLNDGTKDVNDYTVTFTGVDKSDIKSYEVADIDTLYMGANAASTYDKTADVKGVTADGVKVAFSDYTVACDQAIINTTDNKTINSTNLTGGLLKDKDSAEVTFVFTMNDGTTIEKKATLSKAAPQVKTVKLLNDKEAFEVAAASVNASVYTTVKGLIEAKDQYGVDIASSATPRVTVTAINDKDVVASAVPTVTNNGLAGATLSNFAADDSATVTLTFAGGVTFKAKLIVGA